MKMKLTRRERKCLLQQLKIAVAHQIELWDVTLAMAERLGCEFAEVATGQYAKTFLALMSTTAT
jgi:hypothetical protein